MDDRREFWFQEGCHILEMLNDATDPACSVARARVAPGDTTRWHRLSGITERYVILSGSGEVWIGDQSSRLVSVGDVVLIPPMTRQRIRNTGEDDLVFLAICTPRFDARAYQALEDEPD